MADPFSLFTSFFSGLFGGPALIAVFAVAIAILLVPIVFFLRVRASYDLYAYVIDDSSMRIRLMRFRSLGEGRYISVDLPTTILLLTSARPYKARIAGKEVDVYLARRRGLFAFTISPALYEAMYIAENDGILRVKPESAADLVKRLLAEAETIDGMVKVAPELSVAFAFDAKSAADEIILGLIDDVASSVEHTLNVSRSYSSLEKLMKAMTTFAEARTRWLTYLIPIILTIAIAIAIISMFVKP